MFPWAHEGSCGSFMLCFMVKRYGWRGFGHYTQHILSSNTLFFPMLSQIVFCVKAWLVIWGACALHAGECWGTAEKHMASNHAFMLSLSPRLAGAASFEHPSRASLNCIQMRWPLMGIVHHSGQQLNTAPCPSS